MTDLPLITTIIPTYKRPKLLRRAIQSVLKQTYPNFQVCVYDNASGDETAATVAELAQSDPRVKYFCHAQNIGMLANFNYGLTQVNTRYFSLLGDDDVLLPHFYEKTLPLLEKNPDAIFATAATIAIEENGVINSAPTAEYVAKVGENYFDTPDGLYELIGGEHPLKFHQLTAILFRQNILQAFGVFNSLQMGFDLDMILRTAARFPIVIVRQPCALFVAHPASTSNQSTFICIVQEHPQIISNFLADERISLEVSTKGGQLLKQYYSRVALISGVKYLLARDFDKSRQITNVLAGYYKLNLKSFILKYATIVCQKLPFVLDLIAFVYKLRFASVKQKISNFQHDYGQMAKYLEL